MDGISPTLHNNKIVIGLSFLGPGSVLGIRFLGFESLNFTDKKMSVSNEQSGHLAAER